MNTAQIYETIKDVRDFSETMVRTSSRRKRLQEAIELLDNEMKQIREEEFADEVLSLARDRFGGDITVIRVSEMIAVAGTKVEDEKRKIKEFELHLQEKLNKKQKDSAVPVKQYTLDGKYIATYPTIDAAAKAVSVSPSTLSCAITGRTRSSAGYIWKRVDDETPVSSCIIKTCSYPRAVGQYDKNGVLVQKFASISKAAASMGICHKTMSNVLDQNKTLKGYSWKSLDTTK